MAMNLGAGKIRAGTACILALVLCGALAGLYLWTQFWNREGNGGSDAVADVMRYYLPNLLFSRDALLRGELPLWNPDEMLGMPMFATHEYGPLYPPNALFLFLPCRAARLLVGGLHLWMFAVFMFLYLRQSLKLGAVAALCGALVTAFSEWSVLHLCAVPDTYNSAVWLPLVLLLADRLLEAPGPGRAVALGGALALQFFAGEAEISARSGLLLAVYGFFRIGQRLIREKNARAAMAGGIWLGAAALFSLGFAAIQILPTAELSLASVRTPGALRFETAFGGGIGTHIELLRLLIAESTRGNVLFIGLPVLAFAVYALLRPRAEALFFFLLGVASLELIRGTDSMMAWLFYRVVPTGSWFQAPIRFAPFLLLSVTVLAALGTQKMIDTLGATTAKRMPPRSPLLFALVGGVAAFAADRSWTGFDTSVALLSFILMGLLAAALLLVRQNAPASKALAAMFALVPVVSLLACAWNCYPVPDFNIPKEPDLTGLDRSMRDFLREHATQGQRIYADYALGEGRRVPKLGPLLGIPCLNGQSPFTLPEFSALYDSCLTPRIRARETGTGGGTTVGLRGGLSLADGADRLLNLAGVRYLVLGMGNEFFGAPRLNWLDGWTASPPFRLVLRSSDFAIFENGNAWPRAFVVPHEQPEPDFTGPPDKDIPPAEIAEYNAQRVTVRPPQGKAGLLVLTDQFYPGWKAYADGTPRPLERVWQNFRGVRVSGTEEKIVFNYRPATLLIGLGISAATCASAGLLLLARKKPGSWPNERPGDPLFRK